MKIHELKCHTEYFMKVVTSQKKFEIRKNDRNFEVGDVLHLKNYDPKNETYLFGHCLAEVDYIFEGQGFGVTSGYCVMSITVLKSDY